MGGFDAHASACSASTPPVPSGNPQNAYAAPPPFIPSNHQSSEFLMTTNAATANVAVFESIHTSLEKGSELEYLAAADRFSKWLNDPRAYYDQARPVIVHLLETALQRLANVCRHPAGSVFTVANCPPEAESWKNAFRKMVEVAIHFSSHFPEPDLYERLRTLAHAAKLPIPAKVVPQYTPQSRPSQSVRPPPPSQSAPPNGKATWHTHPGLTLQQTRTNPGVLGAQHTARPQTVLGHPSQPTNAQQLQQHFALYAATHVSQGSASAPGASQLVAGRVPMNGMQAPHPAVPSQPTGASVLTRPSPLSPQEILARANRPSSSAPTPVSQPGIQAIHQPSGYTPLTSSAMFQMARTGQMSPTATPGQYITLASPVSPQSAGTVLQRHPSVPVAPVPMVPGNNNNNRMQSPIASSVSSPTVHSPVVGGQSDLGSATASPVFLSGQLQAGPSRRASDPIFDQAGAARMAIPTPPPSWATPTDASNNGAMSATPPALSRRGSPLVTEGSRGSSRIPAPPPIPSQVHSPVNAEMPAPPFSAPATTNATAFHTSTSAPVLASTSTPTPVPPASAPPGKKKAKRKTTLEVVLQADMEWFKQQRLATAQSSASASTSPLMKDHFTSASASPLLDSPMGLKQRAASVSMSMSRSPSESAGGGADVQVSSLPRVGEDGGRDREALPLPPPAPGVKVVRTAADDPSSSTISPALAPNLPSAQLPPASSNDGSTPASASALAASSSTTFAPKPVASIPSQALPSEHGDSASAPAFSQPPIHLVQTNGMPDQHKPTDRPISSPLVNGASTALSEITGQLNNDSTPPRPTVSEPVGLATQSVPRLNGKEKSHKRTRSSSQVDGDEALPAAKRRVVTPTDAQVNARPPPSKGATHGTPFPAITGLLRAFRANKEAPPRGLDVAIKALQWPDTMLHTPLPSSSNTSDPVCPFEPDERPQILCVQRGTYKGDTISMQFDVDQELAAQMRTDEGEKPSSTFADSARRISLACYPFSDTLGAVRDEAEPLKALSQLASTKICAWPRSGQIWGRFKGGQKILLSPPFDAEDGLLDLTSYIVTPGQQTFEIFQTGEQLDLVFVLYLHPPTARHHRAAEGRRKFDAQWTTLLNSFNTPLQFPASILEPS